MKRRTNGLTRGAIVKREREAAAAKAEAEAAEREALAAALAEMRAARGGAEMMRAGAMAWRTLYSLRNARERAAGGAQ